MYSILAAGASGYFRARAKHGVRTEHLYDGAKVIYAMIESYVPKGRMPSLEEIHLQTGLTLDPTVKGDQLDVDLCATVVARRTMGKFLGEKLSGVIDVLNGMGSGAGDPFRARDMLLQVTQSLGWSYGDVASTASQETIRELITSYERSEARRGMGVIGFSSPWPTMDAASLGLQNGEMTVLLAKRKQGKTWSKLAWVDHIWTHDLKPGDHILFASMEMPSLAIYRRLAAIHLKLDYELFRKGGLTTIERERLMKWAEHLMSRSDDKPHIDVVTSAQTPTVRDLATLVAHRRPKLVVIDGLYIFQAPGSDGQWERMLTNITDAKLRLCAEYNIPVLASSQLKGTKASDTLVADSDDAAYAKAIGDYADAVRGLFGTEEHRRSGQRVWAGLESREFEPVDLLINFDLRTMNFSEIQVIDLEAEQERADEEAGEEADDRPARRSGNSGGGRGRRRQHEETDDGPGPVLSI